ncbi:MAG: ATP synthase F1 subunit gamma [Candidatus Cyclonatronum sp.]|uniref:ATP synthase F1 subunit gamma n=1 Tax=Cyclonatronum sp. TaxID=3024185 RepID=UPI0025C431F9|nr:ATP synthase F1 subunit gamma [Cyclonatronum sp.]MCC5934830.1 ATP synthase F1 subunit gamma [Balneolales bacterium]MCH8485364.1 ATP synthase F1 subunit gamma [Cyclonatronum sp.]
MANLREIRDRISSVKSTQQITKAMKMVAAARLRKAQENVLATRPYVAGLQAVIEKLSSSTESQNVFMKEVENPQNVLLIVIGSDRGLCGGFNSNLFRFVTDSLKERFPGFKENGKLSVITIGRKAGDFFGKRDFKVVMKNNGFFDNLRFDRSAEISAEVAAAFKSGEYDSVYIAFNEFKSVIAQNRIFTKLLPVSVDKTEEDSFDNIDYIFEPNPAQILDNIIPLHINMQLWRALLESNASEQGARMAAMDNATENAKEIIGHLNLSYNKARQAAITTELSEIVSGAEALNG